MDECISFNCFPRHNTIISLSRLHITSYCEQFSAFLTITYFQLVRELLSSFALTLDVVDIHSLTPFSLTFPSHYNALHSFENVLFSSFSSWQIANVIILDSHHCPIRYTENPWNVASNSHWWSSVSRAWENRHSSTAFSSLIFIRIVKWHLSKSVARKRRASRKRHWTLRKKVYDWDWTLSIRLALAMESMLTIVGELWSTTSTSNFVNISWTRVA